MIIKLPNADFSTKNIGRVDISGDIRPEVAEILSHLTRPLTETQRFEFQDFYNAIEESGILAKTSHLYVPLLANSLEEVGYNIKTGRVDFTPNSSYYKLSAENGIESITAGANIAEVNRMSIQYNGSQMNHHWMWLPLREYDATTHEGLGYFKTSNAQRRLISSSATSGNQQLLSGTFNGNIQINTRIYPTALNKDMGMKALIASFGTDGTSSYGYMVTEGRFAMSNQPYPSNVTDATYTNELTYLLNSNSNGIFNSYGAFGLGTDLTDEQIIAYYDLLGSLKESLKA